MPHVRAWNRARQSAAAAADRLVLLALDPDFPGLGADVNVFDDGLVQLGTVRPETAELLARLITAALAAESRNTTADVPALPPQEAPSAAPIASAPCNASSAQ